MNRRNFLFATSGLLAAPSAPWAQEAPKPTPASDDIVFADFESGTYDGWTLTGNCWGKAPASDKTFGGAIKDFQGKGSSAPFIRSWEAWQLARLCRKSSCKLGPLPTRCRERVAV